MRFSKSILLFAILATASPACAQGVTTINGLPSATTPLSGTEVLPIWQAGATKKVPAANLLPNSGVTAGSYGDATHCPTITVAASGVVTGASQSTSCPGGGGGGTPANPTATIGASAVNGSATTYMRSDAAPALPATLPALNGSALTSLTPANLSGAVPVAKGGTGQTSAGVAAVTAIVGATGTPSSTTYLRGDGSWSAPAGAGTVTSVATGACLTGGPITGSGTISATSALDAQTGTSYTIPSTDACAIATSNNSSPVAWTLPQATGSFAAGWSFDVWNRGAGLLTIAPTTSTIDGATSLPVPQNTGCSITADLGGNYQVSACTAKSAARNTIAVNVPGVAPNSFTFIYAPDYAFSLPSGLIGSRAYVGVNPTASTTITLYKNASSIGTIVFNTSGSPTITFSTAQTFSTSDVFKAVWPASADATAADFALTFKGARN